MHNECFTHNAVSCTTLFHTNTASYKRCFIQSHFYEKHTKGYISGDNWDIQKIDMGIALCHFELAAEECGAAVSFKVDDPGLQVSADLSYTATYMIN